MEDFFPVPVIAKRENALRRIFYRSNHQRALEHEALGPVTSMRYPNYFPKAASTRLRSPFPNRLKPLTVINAYYTESLYLLKNAFNRRGE